MRGLICRAAVVAGSAVALLLPSVAASATQTPVTSWSPQTSPGTYNYGTLTAGTSVSQTFTLANSGGSATSALTITLTGSAAFTKTADSCTGTSLGPRKSCTVTISYAPASAGQNDSGTLTATAHKAAATASLTLLGAAAKATPAISTSPGPAGPITASTFVTDTATLTGGFNPTGTIEFQLYSTNDCSGPVVDDETVPVSGDGTYTTPDGYMPMEVGTYYWGASYSGDASNNPVASGCGDESVTITPASPAISTTPSPGGLVGSTTVTDTATLTGGFNPFGSIEFELFGPSTTADCTSNALVYVQSAHVSAGIGQYTSNPFTPTTAGTYWWTISYSSGDPNNNSAATTCGAESVTISTASPAISQNPGASPTALGGKVTDTVTLAGGFNPTGQITFVFYNDSGVPIDQETVTVNGDGTYTSAELGPTDGNNDTVAASYSGDANNNAAGPVETSIEIVPA